MKSLVILLSSICIALQAHAQIDKGAFILSANLTYDKYTYNTNQQYVLSNSNTNYPLTSLYGMLSVQYAIATNTTLRVGVGYDDQQNTINASQGDYVLQGNVTSRGVPMLIGLRRWVPIKPLNNYIAFVADLNITTEPGTINDPTLGVKINTLSVNPQVSPGMAVCINKHWIIECMFGGVGYQLQKTTLSAVNNGIPEPTNALKTNHYFLHYMPDAWLLGVNYVFGGKSIAK